MAEFTDEQKSHNYEVLTQSIETMKNGRITEDWMEDHKRQIWFYWKSFSDLSNIEPENKDVQFRAIASTGEFLLNRLVSQIKEYGAFDVTDYLQFCENLKFMVDYFAECWELTDIMSKFNLK